MLKGGICTYCHRDMIPGKTNATRPTRDHVQPRSRGGKKTVPCCFKCNQAKADMSPREWQRFMDKFPEWWKTPGREKVGRKFIAAEREASRSAIPRAVPIEYPNDPKMQAAFEHVFRDRLYMLRVDR